MESKEELKTLRDFNRFALKNDKSITRSLDIIEKDLEVLEIVKKMYIREEVVLPAYEVLIEEQRNAITKEEWDIFREWVNNGKKEKPIQEEDSLNGVDLESFLTNFYSGIGVPEKFSRFTEDITNTLEDIRDILKRIDKKNSCISLTI